MNARIIINALSVLLLSAAAASAGAPAATNAGSLSAKPDQGLSTSNSSPKKPAAKPLTALSVRIVAPKGVDTSDLLVLIDSNAGVHQDGYTGQDGSINFKPIPEDSYRIMVCGPAGFAGGMYSVKGAKLEIVIKVEAPAN